MAGIYIHVPFCAKACHYCDFHFSTDLSHREELTKCIQEELEQRKNYLGQNTVETIYFGGGTPSVLTEKELAGIFRIIHTHFKISENAEITLEANPEDISKEKLEVLRGLSVNRLSIGIQSFDDTTLRRLNRIHSALQASESLILAREAGFKNLNADLIFAIPGRDLYLLKKDIKELCLYQPTHISAYGLTVEEKTVFGRWKKAGKFIPVSEDQNADEFEFLMDALPSSGFVQYEISNFANPGFESRHNSNYWKGTSYLGVGPGAHSYDGKSRQINISSNQAYIRAFKTKEAYWTTEFLNTQDHINEYIMTSLRTREGCDLEYLKQNHGCDLSLVRSEFLQKLNASGQATLRENFLILTKKGKMIADQIASDLFVV